MTGTDQAVVLPLTRDVLEQTLPERFELAAACFPRRIAMTGSGETWTYSELNRRVNRIAHAILAVLSVRTGCVAILAAQSPDMVIATMAVLKAGKAYLGIHPGMPPAAQSEIVADAAPRLMLSTASLAERAGQIAGSACATLILDEIGDEYPDTDPPRQARPGDASSIFYTSGTTGRAKGVVKSHRAVLHRVWLSTGYDAIVPADRQSLLTHCSFSASESDMFGVLLQGGTLCVFDVAAEGLAAFRAWIDEQQITLLHPPVLLFRNLLATLESSGLFPSVRLVALAGDIVLPADLLAWRKHFSPSCVLLHRYSTAETALLTVARFDRDSVLDAEFVAAGRPVPDKTLVIVNESGEPVAPGETGELEIRSRFLADGYWRHAEGTAKAFRPDPETPGSQIYRTGDLGRFLPDGALQFLGRREHMAKIRGFRVDTREVESVVAGLEEVSAAAVIVQRQQHEDTLCAFVVMQPDCAFDARALREKLRKILPDWKIPARLECLPVLPAMLNGKVDRQSLLRAAARDKPAPAAEPSGTIEEELADIWRVALRQEKIGPHDNFFDLGGNSLSAMMALHWIERLYGIRLKLATFLQHGTIAQLATLIGSSAAVPAEPAVQNPAAIDNVSDAFLEMLTVYGVECIFLNPGTDTAPILEAVAKRKATGQRTPELILCLHESAAMAAAHGNFMVSGKPQVMMVHVDVGTLNIGANLHNAQRGRAGVIICAGRSPYTVDGGVAGGRNRYNHWIQEQHHQASTVQGYVKWQYELTRADNLGHAVERAFQLAGADPAGPVYLTLPREVLVEKIDGASVARREPARMTFPAADPVALAQAARWLIAAHNPLILTAYSGRHPDSVAALVKLAEALGAPVVESRHRLNFPSSHPLHIGYAPARYLQRSDCILILDHDVPWIPEQAKPAEGARVIHVDIDPLKSSIPIWGFPVDLSIHAESRFACMALAEEVERQLDAQGRQRIDARTAAIAEEHRAQEARSRQRALDLSAARPIAPEWAAHCLNDLIDEDALVISEAVSNSLVLWTHLRMDAPGSFYQSLGSGLGWGLGAAFGAKLAAPAKTVVCVVGDGSWLFGSPLAVYWAAGQHCAPFLTVVLNNHEYFATTEAILSTAPTGHARQSGHYPGCDLPKPPLFVNVAEALGLWARTVEDPAELAAVLREALGEVRRGRSALVDICISSARPAAGMPQ